MLSNIQDNKTENYHSSQLNNNNVNNQHDYTLYR